MSKIEAGKYSERLAIEYLAEKGVSGLPGKAYSMAHVDLVVWGCVRVEVKYATVRNQGAAPFFTWGKTPIQQKEGFLAEVVLLICDYLDRQTYHFFRPSADVFSLPNGRKKTYFLYTIGKRVETSHFPNLKSLSVSVMNEAEDRIGLIEEARLNWREHWDEILNKIRK